MFFDLKITDFPNLPSDAESPDILMTEYRFYLFGEFWGIIKTWKDHETDMVITPCPACHQLTRGTRQDTILREFFDTLVKDSHNRIIDPNVQCYCTGCETKLDQFRKSEHATKKHRIDKGIHDYIEPLILPLVRAINFAGFYTTSSCEGHFEPNRRNIVPFVCFTLGEESDLLPMIMKQIKVATQFRWKLVSVQYLGQTYYSLQPTLRTYEQSQRVILLQKLPQFRHDVVTITHIFDMYRNPDLVD